MGPRLVALLIAGAALLCAASARAADLSDVVPGHAGMTYLDLMKRVVTDLAPVPAGGASGHQVVAFKHIEGQDQTADPPDPITLNAVDVMRVPGDAGRIVVLADLGPSEGAVADATLLALFKLAPAPKLLDVVEVGSDRLVGFRIDKPALLAPGSPLILIDSEHDNSDQSYVSTAMIYIRDDRFSLIDTVFTFGDQACSYKRTQEPSFTTLASPGPYRAVHVRVREEVTLSGEDCGADERPPRAGVRIFQGAYDWDPRRGRFIEHGRALDRLAKADAKRF